jgi:hypothetical protein
MTDKTPTSVNLTNENLEYLDSETDNRSAFINRLIREYREGGSTDAMMQRYRLELLSTERGLARKRMESLQEQIDEIQSAMETAEERREREFTETAERMDGIPADPSNPAVQTQAENLDMEPSAFADRLETWREGR